MQLAGLGNTRILTGYAQKSPRSPRLTRPHILVAVNGVRPFTAAHHQLLFVLISLGLNYS